MSLKLLMTADAVGGVWQYATDLAGALAPLGVETVLATMGPAPSTEQRRAAHATPGLTLVETDLPLDWLCDGPAPVLAAGEAIARLAAAHRVDLMQLNMPTLAAATRFPVPVVAVTHGCVATWWEAAHAAPLLREFHWQRDLMRAGLTAVDAVVAPSATYAATIARHYDMPLPTVVHNGRTPMPLPTGIAPPAAAFTAGRLWDQVKNTALLDAVAARLPFPLRAAGALRGPHGETVAPTNLVTLGQLSADAMADELAGRPIFVSAATFEPFGLAVLEAASAGCPLVLSEIGTFRELWDGAATFVSGDADAYAAAIMRLADDPEHCAAMGAAARARAARYTPAASAAAMTALYTRLLSTRDERAAA